MNNQFWPSRPQKGHWWSGRSSLRGLGVQSYALCSRLSKEIKGPLRHEPIKRNGYCTAQSKIQVENAPFLCIFSTSGRITLMYMEHSLESIRHNSCKSRTERFGFPPGKHYPILSKTAPTLTLKSIIPRVLSTWRDIHLMITGKKWTFSA